ncbi:MAG: HaeIII family restriction endonuclease [Candidatus Cloacimonadaceae bacterium]|nr:HaeIII family restriction endonuclease [Candidatus Cloacimonadaceae bacterium]
MPISSNHNGRAFEFITLKQFEREISKFRSVLIDEGGGYAASAKSSEMITNELRLKLEKSAEIAVEIVLSLEPLILIQNTDRVVLKILTDEAGKQGDVRDIVIEQPDIEWVIGLSLKHNHKAVKHSRLSKGLDFGKMWYGIPCSQNYWNDIKPVFDKLETLAQNKTEWKGIKDKSDSVYLPLLIAFMDEIMRAKARHPR